jgi:hypothetical protein
LFTMSTAPVFQEQYKTKYWPNSIAMYHLI